MNLAAVWKPWFVYRPHQLARRLASSISAPPPGHRLMPVSWGVELWADPSEHVGRSLWTTGVFDLAVSEVLFRLVRPGDFVVDVGANLGYMTLLGAVASGPDGRVLAFEPNPHVAAWLRRNVEHGRRQYEMAAVELRDGALGAEAGSATLVLPDPASANDGLGHIAAGHSAANVERMVQVAVATLDGVIGGHRAGLMKVDVEGHEEQVLEGAACALHAHRIRHVLFEDHEGAGSRAMALLRAAGYEIFSIGWSMRGPVLAPAADGSLASPFEAPSYLATTETRSALEACARTGWLVLQHQVRAAAEVVEA